MHNNLLTFYKEKLNDFIQAVINLFLFLPYFFCVPNLLKTLFSPWKNLISKEKTAGFSLNVWLTVLSFNAISGTIGFIMRSAIILFYFLLQAIFLILLPFIFIIYFLLIPLFYLVSLSEKTEEEKKETARLKFIGSRLLNHENFATVTNWFEDYYKTYIFKAKWWKLSNLFSVPPLARDWAVGYTPTLDQYSQDLTSYSYQIKTLSIVDREKEISEIERALIKSQDANVIVVGEEGVGKHTIIVALAKKLFEGKSKNLLMYKRVVWLNMEKILNQASDLQKREQFFEELLNEAAEAKNIIVFIDKIDQYITSEHTKVDLTTSLEKFAKLNQFQIIGVTTPFFYEKYFFTNERLSRLFAKIEVKEVKPSEAEKILLQLAFSFERRYSVILPYETVKEAIQKSDFYITAIPFPEKAIDLLDSACVYVSSETHSQDISQVVGPEIIDKVLTEKTHVPTTLTENNKQKLVHLEELLLNQIVNQQQAITKLSSALRRSFLLLGKRKKPLAGFLFLGPTGVGKTETAKSIAKIFFGGEGYLVRFDMSNFQSTDDIPKLIGSLDTGNPGLLAKAIRENPYGVLLLDEIEKANKDLLNIFLTMLDEGYFTDGFGKRVDCKNLAIIATSNAGSDRLFLNPQGSREQNSNPEGLINYLIEQKTFSPEFLNRFDEVITFNSLDRNSVKEIGRRMIQRISEDIYVLHKVKLTVSGEYLNDLINRGYDQKFGARNLERLLRDQIEDKIAKLVLEDKAKPGQSINL